MSEPQIYQGREARRLPIQLVIMIAFVGVMMLLIWLKLASPEFKESYKAQQTAQFYLEALGKAPIDKLGSELHPDVRKTYNHESLAALYKTLGIDKGVTILQMREEAFVKEPAQWSWRIDVKTATQARVPLLVSVRQPSAQSIARRWRVYALCRPDLALPVKVREFLSDRKNRAEWPGLERFKPAAETSWKLVSTNPPTMLVPGQDPKERLTIRWLVSPDGQLGCDYQRSNVGLVHPEAKK